MRKQTKLVAVLSAAALLAIGASMTSFAAQGWQEENGQWYYYDNNGDYVYGEWKKSGNNWFYLGDDGAMMTDSLIEDGSKTYYVNANGAMVTNSWVAVEPGEDADADAPAHYWYYFGANGQAVKQTGSTIKKKVLNGKTYAFDSDGKMLYGFVDEDGERLNSDDDPYENALYYFGTEDDGAMHTDWLLYTDGSSDEAYDDYDEMWFYFKPSTGKKISDDETTIRGNKYLFDDKGVMMYDWQNTESSTSTPNKYFSDQYDGHLRKKTWIWAIPDEDMNYDDYNDDTSRWFYVGSNGKVYQNLRTVNGKKYLFDEEGIMKAGLQVVTDGKAIGNDAIKDGNGDVTGEEIRTANLGDGTYLYYFGDEETDGSMKTGKNIKIELDDGETYTFGFEKSGKGMDGFEDKNTKFYANGLLFEASDDYRYQAFEVEKAKDANGGLIDPADIETTNKAVTGGTIEVAELGNGYRVVSNSGTVVKDKKYVKDADGNYYAVNADGEVMFVSSDNEYASKIASCWSKDGVTGNFKTNDDGDPTGWTCD